MRLFNIENYLICVLALCFQHPSRVIHFISHLLQMRLFVPQASRPVR
jgi:hypothetical protein